MDSKEIQLNKLFLIPTSTKIEVLHESETFYEYKKENIGWFDSKEAAEVFLDDYPNNDQAVFAYEIKGPEHGFGKSDLILNESDGLYDEVYENDDYDESPEFQLIYGSNKHLISSYFYDKNNPGGRRLNEENTPQKGDKAYALISIFIGDEEHSLLIPVIIKGKATDIYLENKWCDVIHSLNKIAHEGCDVDAPSKERVRSKIDSLLNIEKDSIVFKPLVTVLCNWGEEPQRPIADCPRIDILPFDIMQNADRDDLLNNLRSRITL